LKVTFLGTGTSQGIPVIACPCEVCHSTNPRDNRLRTSVMITEQDFTLVVDSGPDFRQQMLREQVKKLDAIVITHSHNDHIAGLDDIRAFNYFSQKPMDVYATSEVQEGIRREFFYAFEGNDYPWLPKMKFYTIDARPFTIGPFKIIPVEVLHHRLPVMGFRFSTGAGGEDFTYITDANFIAPGEIDKILGTRVLVLNALRKDKHISHFSLNEAIEMSKVIGAEQTYLTHISHQMGLHDDISEELPSTVFLAYDRLTLEV